MATARFDLFVVLAEMRTGSNFLESNLNALNGVTCFGEAFNPMFPGAPNQTDLLGVTLADRDADPLSVVSLIAEAPGGLNGFRLFQNHDARVEHAVLANPRCAKIVLTRNPLDSFVSWKIAQATDQWKLTNVTRRKDQQVDFDPAEFADHLDRTQARQLEIQRQLQVTGQTAFHISYDDLHDLEVLNGLAAWLGVPSRLEGLRKTLKRQNPDSVLSKVTNPDVMARAVAAVDWTGLSRTPNLEPRRGPSVPEYIAGARAPLLYLPLGGGPDRRVTRWLADLDAVSVHDLQRGFTQSTLRQWKRAHPGHRAFCVVRHPLARAHAVFCEKVVSQPGPDRLTRVRNTLERQFDVALPEDPSDPAYTPEAHRTAFQGFLRFLKANLAGQTPMQVQALWASQTRRLEGMAQFAVPHLVLREDELNRALPDLALAVGYGASPTAALTPTRGPYALAQVYDDRLEAMCQDIYGPDYLNFGFQDWDQT